MRGGHHMHAVVAKVRIKSGRNDEAMQMLHSNVVPQVKEAPGLVRATWFGDTDTETGGALLVFESEEQARQMAGLVSFAEDDPVEVQDVKVYEVNAEA